MSATKEELEEMGKDLFKRLGGMRTKDGRIVRALLALWKAAESNLAVIEAEQSGAQRTDATQIIEDLLKLIYAYQDMHNRLGIGGEQSPSVLRAKEWLDANR